jgi:hypothetical protein
MLTRVFKIALVAVAIVLFIGDPLLGTFAALSDKRKP